MIAEIKKEQNAINFDKVLCVKSDGKTHLNFGICNRKILHQTFYYKGSLKDAKDDQYKMFTLLNDLRNYKPKSPDKIK